MNGGRVREQQCGWRKGVDRKDIVVKRYIKFAVGEKRASLEIFLSQSNWENNEDKNKETSGE